MLFSLERYRKMIRKIIDHRALKQSSKNLFIFDTEMGPFEQWVKCTCSLKLSTSSVFLVPTFHSLWGTAAIKGFFFFFTVWTSSRGKHGNRSSDKGQTLWQLLGLSPPIGNSEPRLHGAVGSRMESLTPGFQEIQ